MDVLLDTDNDLLFRDGDIVIAPSKEQHIKQILFSEKGDWKQFPIVGIGIKDYINSPLTRKVKTTLEKEILLQLQSDNFIQITAKVESWSEINIEADKDE